jgi:pimeloyl-ACP methyl ester carboxylesterase
MSPHRSRWPLRLQIGLRAGLLVALTALIGGSLFAAAAASASAARPVGSSLAGTTPPVVGAKPTVVLVHGAFADASGWAGVVKRLHARGFTVIATANPLRGVESDAAYLKSILASIPGPLVLAGHSYGGEVITNAATGNPNVKALVYIAAFAPEQGETSGQLTGMFPGTGLTPQNLVFKPYPLPNNETGTDGYINPAVFRAVFCADLPADQAAVMAASQRPAELATLGQPSGVPAWKTIPSWYLVAKQDKAIPPAAERFMATRMLATTIEINSSHVAMTSHPDAVTDLILSADRATR